MFLLHCAQDDSLCIQDDSDVIFGESVRVGDCVKFFYGNKEYEGTVKARSDDSQVLSLLLKSLKNEKQYKASKSDEGAMACKRTSVKREILGVTASTKSKAPSSKVKRQTKNPKESAKSKKMKASQVQCAIQQEDSRGSGNNSETICDGESSSDSDGSIYNAKISELLKVEKKKNEEALQPTTKLVNSPECSSTQLRTIGTASKSPTKEELKRLLGHYMRINPAGPSKILTEFNEPSFSHKGQKGPPSPPLYQTKDLSGDSGDAINLNLANDSFKSREEVRSTHSRLAQDTHHRLRTSTSKHFLNDDDEKNDPSVSQHFHQNNDPELSEEFPENILTQETGGRLLDQLYGENYIGDQMTHLLDGVYCKSTTLASALGAAKHPTHLVRRLVLGVFKQESVINCTVSGQAPRAAGSLNVDKDCIQPLDPVAKQAIIKFAKKVGKAQKWPSCTSSKLLSVLSQRIGEIKRDAKKKH